MASHYHFVTGRLAEKALRATLEQLEPLDFKFSIDVLPITVAALMTPKWITRHIQVDPAATHVMVPGYCEGDFKELAEAVGCPVVLGPRDLRRLGEHFGGHATRPPSYGCYDIEIIAEINHAPKLPLAEILQQADQLRAAGADLIDVGCDPGEPWREVGDCVRALCDAGHRVSIDSLNPAEIAPAVRAGAELVLSVNSSNRDAALDWGCDVVVIPDDIPTLDGLDETVDLLARHRVPLRIDPILEPIGCGFAASLARYQDVRNRYPDAEMMMGIGNLTELTDADSAGINVLLLGICQELGIRSVLTTEVINWARSSVRECDLARRLVHFAVEQGIPPKHLEERLVLLRDTDLSEHGAAQFENLVAHIKDNNYRLFSERTQLHAISAGIHVQGTDPFQMFEQLVAAAPRNVDASHAFYLGFELSKALTALTLGKQYEQDQALDWGFLTTEERHHRLSRSRLQEDNTDPSAATE
jgi:dihydropteroate synthase-like protein